MLYERQDRNVITKAHVVAYTMSVTSVSCRKNPTICFREKLTREMIPVMSHVARKQDEFVYVASVVANPKFRLQYTFGGVKHLKRDTI